MRKASEMFTDEMDLNEIFKMSYDEAFETILKVPGVGPKVADCILLYGFNFREAFPSDVWIKRIVSHLYFDGKDITNDSITDRAKAGISFAFQQPVRFKGITVKDLISLAAGKNTSVADACAYLSEVGLCAKDYINRQVDGSLSGGELKRIEIAMINARGTKLSVFDEPEAGIDLWSFNNLIKVFETMYQRTRGSIVIISHQERILNIADKIVVISGGGVAEYGTKDEILPGLLDVRAGCRYTKEGI
jgi:Fe-S cluster assembly ATP-binding protein